MNRIILAAKVRSLQKARAENGQQLQKRLKEARQRGVTGDDLQEIYADYGPEDVLYEDEIHELWTRYLREKAELRIPANVTGHSGDRDRFAHGHHAGVSFVL